MNKGTILVIDDDREMRDSLRTLLSNHGFDVHLQSGAQNTVQFLQSNNVDTILCDVRMPGMSGLELLEQMVREDEAPLVLMSAHGDISMAVQALHDGAFTFLEKPFDPKLLLSTLDKTTEHGQLRRRERRLRERLAELAELDRVLLGESPALRRLRDDVSDIADSPANVLIVGETGTGKELVAKAIHDLSSNSGGAFVAVNCAMTSAEQFDVTLFGMGQGRSGLLSRADQGTLFLDELGAMAPQFQPKLLRAIETQEFLSVGSDEPKRSHFRLISAASTNLAEALTNGDFRQDLLFRLNTVTLELPPLRARGEDIPFLHRHFLEHFANVYSVEVPSVTADDISAIMTHEWPGNIRELRNLCECQILLSRRGGVSVADAINFGHDIEKTPETLREAVAAFERQLITKALLKNDGRMDDVAEVLGIGRRTLNEKIVKLGLNKERILSG